MLATTRFAAYPELLAAQHVLSPALPLGPETIVMPARSVVIPMELVLGGRAAVRVMLNGRGPFLLAIETGAPIVIVTERAAQAAHIERGARQIDPHITWPSGGSATALTLDSLRIGDALLRNQPVFTGPDFLPGVDGLLGLPAYAALLTTLDYPGKRLILAQGELPRADELEVFDVVTMNGRMGIMIDIGGVRMPALIDTQGGSDVAVSTAVAQRLAFDAPLVEEGKVKIGDHDFTPLMAARLSSDIRIGRYALTKPIVRANSVSPGEAEAIIGLGLLREFELTLDQRNKRIRLHRAEAAIAPAPPLRVLGVALGRGPNESVVIATLIDGSAAAKATLRAGDEVIEIAGMAASDVLATSGLSALVQRGGALHFVIRRDGARIELDVEPRVLVP